MKEADSRFNASGKIQFEKEIKQSGMMDINLIEITMYFNKSGIDQLYLDIGRGEISLHQLSEIIKKPEVETKPSQNSKSQFVKATILVDGMSNVATSIAHCCMPSVGDKIKWL